MPSSQDLRKWVADTVSMCTLNRVPGQCFGCATATPLTDCDDAAQEAVVVPYVYATPWAGLVARHGADGLSGWQR